MQANGALGLDPPADERHLDRLSRQVRQLDAHCSRLAEHSSIAIAFLADRRHLYCNAAWTTLFGGDDQDAFAGTSILDLVSAADRPRLEQALTQDAPPPLIVTADVHGEALPVTLTLAPSLYKATSCLLVEARPAPVATGTPAGTTQDIIARLDNMPWFTTRLASAIRARAQEAVPSILLVTRIDRFRRVQECIGKAATLRVLGEIAGFLQHALSKPYTAARLAQDEFGVLLFDSTPDEGARLAAYIAGQVTDRLLPSTATNITLSVSTGLTVIDSRDRDPATVIRRARLNTGSALKHAGGRHVHAPAMVDAITDAMAGGRLAVRYQPVVSFDPGAPPCYEATVDLTDAVGTPLSRDDMLACANMHNLAATLDKGLLESVLGRPGGINIQVPVSSNSLAAPDLPDWLADQLHRQQRRGEGLFVLVSEMDLHNQRQEVVRFCQAMDALGIATVLCDFGVSPDPLPALAALQPAGVRLAPAMVRDLPYSRQQQQRVRKLVAALHHLDTGVAVTGVEDTTLLPLLFDLGVTHVQGDCLQPPTAEPGYRFPTEHLLTMPGNRDGKTSRDA